MYVITYPCVKASTSGWHQFLPEASFGLRVLSMPASVCVCMYASVCVSLCVNHLLVREITLDPFKLGSPSLTHQCKANWLRTLLFLWNDRLWPSNLTWKSKFTLFCACELLRAVNHNQLKPGFPNLDQKCILALLGSLLILGLIDIDLQFHF